MCQKTFFEYLAENYNKDEHTYISWDCTPDDKTICPEIKQRWENLTDIFLKGTNNDVRVPFMQFENLPFENKKGEVLLQLKNILI